MQNNMTKQVLSIWKGRRIKRSELKQRRGREKKKVKLEEKKE